MIDCIIVGIGGFLGAACRYIVGMIPLKEGCIFPVKTFIINITGSFIIGILAALAMKANSLNPRILLFLKVGLCGGFTTFSSFTLETSDLAENGRIPIAILYAVLSVTVGIFAVFAGQKIVRKI